MVTFMRGREGTLRASAGRSILRRFSASERPAAGHRSGRLRAIPSQVSRSKGSSHEPKHKTYVVSARVSIRGRRGEGTVRRGPDVARSARRPQVEILAENPYIFRLISRLDPLERLPCDGLVLQRPARCPAAGRSEAENRRKIDLPAEARSVPSRPLMNVTITG